MGIPRLNKETSLFRANAIPDYVAGVVTEAKAAIKVTTDQIALEVSRKVGTSEVISRINQSPESVTIDADRLDIATSTDGGNGVFVHPRNDATTGWRISNALELLKGGLSCFKVWLDSSVTKVRVGLETAGHTVFLPDGMEVFSDASTNVAEFGASGARIGKASNNHVTIDDDSIDMSHSGVEMVHFGYGDGNASSGTGTAPYYTLGVRRSTTAAYDPSSTYAVGDHVRYDGTEYVCIVAIPTAEPWNAGHWTSAIGNYSAVDGFNATAGGYCSHAEGYETTASGPYSHAEGRNTAATGSNASHAEGRETTASGTTSHAEGYNATASGIYSHAEGASTKASNYAAHAEGGLCEASGWASHAEGYDTTASGNYSHAQNVGTVAAYINQTAIGKYNDNQSTNAFEIGNGTSDSNRSNAFAITWDGRPEYGTDVSTSVLADIISAESGVTFTRAKYVQSGRVAMLEVRFSLSSTLSVPANGNFGDITIGTLVTGKRPAIGCHPASDGDGAGITAYYLDTSGHLILCAADSRNVAYTIAAGGEFTAACTYIIA